MSLTTAEGGSRSSARAKGASPTIPRVVVLTSRAVPSSACSRSRHGITRKGPPRSAARASAREAVRLTRRISSTPASTSATATDRAAPPAPTTTAGPAPAFQSGQPARRFSMKPKPSVERPSMVPPSWITRVLTAPMRRARSSTTSAIASAVSLCGTVTLAPENPSLARPRTASSKCSGRTVNGT